MCPVVLKKRTAVLARARSNLPDRTGLDVEWTERRGRTDRRLDIIKKNSMV
jgi:hypothetical protein